MTRRQFLAMAGSGAMACGASSPARGAEGARLTARPGRATVIVEPGEHALEIGSPRDGLLYVPAAVRRDVPSPFALMLHGANNQAKGMQYTYALAEEHRVVLLLVDSRGRTWDAINGDYGADVAFIDKALAHVFDRWTIDATRLAIGGFSDGASYAIGLGLANGDLFSRIVAFSPGFIPRAERRGKPRLFISHGTDDQVLPIGQTSWPIVSMLQAGGYQVTYREFSGRHTVPPEIARDSFGWMVRE